MSWKLFLVGALLSVSSAGCMSVTAVRSVQGKAYVVRANGGGSAMWNCDASSGEPICYKVVETEQPKSK
jgi:hypothetical protein